MTNLIFTIIFSLLGTHQSAYPEPNLEIVYFPSLTNTETEFKMREQAYNKSFKYTESLVRIAICESRMGKYRKNWEGSSAEGLLMFKPATFAAYCAGSIKNDKDQVNCFMKMYPEKKSWWQCR